MTNLERMLLGCAMAGACCWSSGQLPALESSPEDMVKAGVATLARAATDFEPGKPGGGDALVNAIHEFLLAYTDVPAASRLILGTHWKDATPAQRHRFTAAYNAHVTRLLVDLVPGVDFESVRVEPYSGNLEDVPLTIAATFRNRDRQTIQFVLVIHHPEERWLILDVVAEGISYVKLYRSQFDREISENGLEATIDRLENQHLLGSVLRKQPQ